MDADARLRMYAAGAGTALLFVAVQAGALALVRPFEAAGYQAVENPSNPVNSLVYLVAILVATGLILAVIKLGIDWLLRAIVTAMSGLLSLYVFSVIVPPTVGVVGGAPVLAWLLAGALAVALYAYPEWYVIDAVGVIIGAGGAGLFGISFGPLPAILLLSVLAVYDAVSVYGTEHMLTLAESVTDLKLPLVLVVPLSLSYSFLADDAVDAHDEDDSRDAFFIGLGDTVMPTILVASAAHFVDAPLFGVAGVALNAPALGAAVGTLVGLAGLLWLVAKGRAHAGLPLLNGGSIAGYLIGAALAGVPLLRALGVAGSL